MCTYWHVIDEDTNETVATYTDPVKASARAAHETLQGRFVVVNAPATVRIEDQWFAPGQLISVEEVTGTLLMRKFTK